ncbi:MAG: hypothetical protein A2166_03035 [Omnitrophica WOR_2 bacterium RBG_13_41_10]|nr:MAG: hypothetical protein A2166_03035 [Omnitrophica WOR_2 bacterium RBG_13_41_10]
MNRALVKKGIEVTVYTTNVGLDDSVAVNQELDIEGVKVTYFGFIKLFEFLGTVGWQFSRHITRALKSNLAAFELIYIVDIWSYPATIAAYYSRLYGKPYVVVPSGMFYPRTFYKKIWKKWPYYHFAIKRYLEEASAIHYTSRDEAEKTHSFLNLNNRAIVIPNGIELSEFSNFANSHALRAEMPLLKDKKIILFLGRLTWTKGLDILVQAYAMLRKDVKDAHLLIVGIDQKSYSQKIKRWVRERGMNLDTDITFTGMLTGNDKLKAYKACDIFVLPSYSENFGMTIVEAMACGVPVIISDKVGIHKEIECNKAGIVIEPNAQSLYQAMKLLLENAGLRKEVSINGRKMAEEYYDIDKVADKMITAYQEILKIK